MYYEENFDELTSTWWYRTNPRAPWAMMPAEMVAKKLHEIMRKHTEV